MDWPADSPVCDCDAETRTITSDRRTRDVKRRYRIGLTLISQRGLIQWINDSGKHIYPYHIIYYLLPLRQLNYLKP